MTKARQSMELPGYEITGRLGDGGMATVYKGVQHSLKRPVAIKILKSALLTHTEIRRRFERESLIIARLDHPNIINVIDQGVTAVGLPFFVMNYVNGDTLDVALKKHSGNFEYAIDLFVQIAKGLAYAHKNRIIHCDIKPQNIIIDSEGNARVLDFGIAQIFKRLKNVNQSDQNFIMGSVSYMAPEQYESAASATKKSDIYSLGVIMYEYFTGRLPNYADLIPASKLNPGVSKTLNQIISACLAENPAKRPRSADDLVNRLLWLLQGKHLDKEQHQRATKGVNKNFRLLDIVKENKFSSVYVFQDHETKAFFMIKKKPLYSKGYETSQEVAKLEHPNILKIHGTSKNQRSFVVVSDYCAGGSLAERISRPYSLPEFYPAVIAIVEALNVAHRNGITHGNLRPSNILFDAQGTIKLGDFGLDEHYDTPEGNDNWYALDNELAGEQFDIYSLGVIFYQMLTGELPERKYSKFVPSEAYTKLPENLQILISTMLKLDRKKRTASFSVLLKTLRNFAESAEEKTEIIQHPSSKNLADKTTQMPTNAAKKSRQPQVAAAVCLGICLSVFYAQIHILFPEIPEQIALTSAELIHSAKLHLSLLNGEMPEGLSTAPKEPPPPAT